MTKEEIQASIKSIMFSGSVCGIEIYACLRDESGYQTKKIRATDKLLSSTKDKVAGCINEQDIQSISPIFLPRYKNVQLMQGLTNNKLDFRIQVKGVFGTERN